MLGSYRGSQLRPSVNLHGHATGLNWGRYVEINVAGRGSFAGPFLMGGFVGEPKKHGSTVAAGDAQPLPLNQNCIAFSCLHKDALQVDLEQN